MSPDAGGTPQIDVLDYIRDPRHKFDQLVMQEDIRNERLNETVDQIQRMDLTIKRPKTMTNMLKSKVEEVNDLKIESVMVEGEYRLGINDPSRTAAQWERVKGMRKNIGKKAIINDFIRRVQGMKDAQLKLNNKIDEF